MKTEKDNINISSEVNAQGGTVNIENYITAHTYNEITIQINSASSNSTSTVSQVIDKIKQYYQDNATIKLPVFNIPQHVKDSYINLAIVDHETQNKSVLNGLQGRLGTLEGDNLSIMGRNQTYEDIHRVKDPIDMEKLFDRGNRVVVIGRAGIGKSTFCKYIAYKWQDKQESRWSQFTMIYWLPLRYLSNYAFRENYAGIEELSSFIVHAIPKLKIPTKQTTSNFSVKPNEISAQILQQAQTTLFVLDGYDEIQAFIKGDSPAQQRTKEFLDYILNTYKNYIITSRPHAVMPGTFPMVDEQAHYELMGFTNDDIPLYVTKTFALLNENRNVNNQLDSTQAIGLLRKNPCIWGVAHVPINLALICSVWDKKFIEEIETINMTQLYTAIISRLYKINLSKLWNHGNNDYFRMLDKQISAEVDHPFNEFFKECAPLISFLEELAFLGMRDNQLIFSHEQIEKLLPEDQRGKFYKLANKRMNLPTPTESDLFPTASIMQFICRLGIINSLPDGVSRDAYYFIHLTFQEYFAANHLKKLWLNEDTHPQAVEYLKTIMSDSRFEVVIWFFAGALHKEVGLGHALNEFFSILIANTQSSLVNNPFLLMLLCRCLEEISLDNIDIKDEIIHATLLFLERILFYTHYPDYAHLANYRKPCVDALKFSPKLLQALNLENRLIQLKETPDAPLWATVVHSELYAQDVIGNLIKIIDNKNKRLTVRKNALENLAKLNDPLKINTIVPCLVRYLSDNDAQLYQTAWNGLAALNQENHTSIIAVMHEKLNKLAGQDKLGISFCIEKLQKFGHITRQIIIQCFLHDLLSNISYFEKNNLEELLILCREIIKEPAISANDSHKLKSLIILDRHKAVTDDDFKSFASSISLIWEIDSAVSFDCSGKDKDFVNKLFGSIVRDCILNRKVFNLCIATQFIKDNNVGIPELTEAIRYLSNGATYFSPNIQRMILEINFDAEAEAAQKSSNASFNMSNYNENFSTVNNKKRTTPRMMTEQLVIDLKSQHSCEEAKSKFDSLESQQKEIVAKKCYSYLRGKNEKVVLTAAQILFGFDKTDDETVDLIISIISQSLSLLSAKEALITIQRYNDAANEKNVLHLAYHRNLSHAQDHIVLCSLTGLLTLGTALSNADCAAIDECFDKRGDALEDYTDLKQLYDQCLFKMGKLHDGDRYQKLNNQLDHLDPKARLAATQLLMTMTTKQSVTEKIERTLFGLTLCLDENIRNAAFMLLNTNIHKLNLSTSNYWLMIFSKNLHDPDPKIVHAALQGLALLLNFSEYNFHQQELWVYQRLCETPHLPEIIINYLENSHHTYIKEKSYLPDNFGVTLTLFRHKKIEIETVLNMLNIFVILDSEEVLLLFFGQFKFLDLELINPSIDFYSNLFSCAASKHSKVCSAAREALLHPCFFENSNYLTALLTMLTTEQSSVREFSMSILRAIQPIPHFNDDQINFLSAILSTNFNRTINDVIIWLDTFDVIPLKLEPLLITCLFSKDGIIRLSTLSLLYKHNLLLTTNCLNDILMQLTATDPSIREFCITLLSSLLPLPHFSIQQIQLITKALECNFNLTNIKLITWLKTFASLPDSIEKALFGFLSSKNDEIRNAAQLTLQHHHVLEKPDRISLLLVMLSSESVRTCTFILSMVRLLNPRPDFNSAQYLPQFHQALLCGHSQIRLQLLTWLLDFDVLPDHTIPVLFDLLSHDSLAVKNSALQILKKNEHELVKTSLHLLLQLLISENINKRRQACALLVSLAPVSIITAESLISVNDVFLSSFEDSHDALTKWLMKFTTLQENVLLSCIARLSNSNGYVRKSSRALIVQYKSKFNLENNYIINMFTESHFFSYDCQIILQSIHDKLLHSPKNYQLWRCWQLTMVLFLSLPVSTQHVFELKRITQLLFFNYPYYYTLFDNMNRLPRLSFENDFLANGLIVLINSLSDLVNFVRDDLYKLSEIMSIVRNILSSYSLKQPLLVHNDADFENIDLRYAEQVQQALLQLISECIDPLGPAPCPYYIKLNNLLAYDVIFPGDLISYTLVYFLSDTDPFKTREAHDYFLTLTKEFSASIDYLFEQFIVSDVFIINGSKNSVANDHLLYSHFIYSEGIEESDKLKLKLRLLTQRPQSALSSTMSIHDIKVYYLIPLYNMIINKANKVAPSWHVNSFSDLFTPLEQNLLFPELYTEFIIEAHQWLCAICDQSVTVYESIDKLRAIEAILLNPYYELTNSDVDDDTFFWFFHMHKEQVGFFIDNVKQFSRSDELLYNFSLRLFLLLINKPMNADGIVLFNKLQLTPHAYDSVNFIKFMLRHFDSHFSEIPWYDLLNYAQQFFENNDALDDWDDVCICLLTWMNYEPDLRLDTARFLCEFIDHKIVFNKFHKFNKSNYKEFDSIEALIEDRHFTLHSDRTKRKDLVFQKNKHDRLKELMHLNTEKKRNPRYLVEKDTKRESHTKQPFLMHHKTNNKAAPVLKSNSISSSQRAQPFTVKNEIKHEYEARQAKADATNIQNTVSTPIDNNVLHTYRPKVIEISLGLTTVILRFQYSK